MNRPERSSSAKAALISLLCGLSSPAWAITCDDIKMMLAANLTTSIIATTIRGSSPPPTAEDLKCLQAAGVPDDVLAAVRERMAKPTAVPSAPPTAPSPTPPAQSFEVVVSGMDAAHSAAARDAGSKFLPNLEFLTRQHCSVLQRTSFKVEVIYSSADQRTYAKVETIGLPASAMRFYPGGRFVPVTCGSMVAMAAFRTWRVDAVFVRQNVDKGTLVWGYSHSTRYGPVPFGLLVETAKGKFEVPLYKQSSSSVKLEYPKNLPDGAPNPTARLREIIGEELE